MKISKAMARRMIVTCQGLDGSWDLPKGRDAVAEIVSRLGYVQIDAIAVLQRAHHHTIWLRQPQYEPDMLHALLAEDRRVFEYWAPAASYVPMSDYRYYLPQMRDATKHPHVRRFLATNASLGDDVLDRIRSEGPLGAADFAAPEGKKRGSWWDWKPAKHALEAMFAMGKLMVTERRNFQRIYDLAERVLPAGSDTREPTAEEWARFAVRRSLGTCGLASARDVQWSGCRRGIVEALEELTADGEVTEVRVAGLDDGMQYYALTASLAQAGGRSNRKKHMHILSPFDGAVTHRGRLEALFDFEYKLECYFPEAKRRWGYFCLPILWGHRFVGRIDAKADRKRRTLTLKKLMFEPAFTDYDKLIEPLAAKLGEMAVFNMCEEIVIEASQPKKLRAAIQLAANRHIS